MWKPRFTHHSDLFRTPVPFSHGLAKSSRKAEGSEPPSESADSEEDLDLGKEVPSAGVVHGPYVGCIRHIPTSQGLSQPPRAQWMIMGPGGRPTSLVK